MTLAAHECCKGMGMSCETNSTMSPELVCCMRNIAGYLVDHDLNEAVAEYYRTNSHSQYDGASYMRAFSCFYIEAIYVCTTAYMAVTCRVGCHTTLLTWSMHCQRGVLMLCFDRQSAIHELYCVHVRCICWLGPKQSVVWGESQLRLQSTKSTQISSGLLWWSQP